MALLPFENNVPGPVYCAPTALGFLTGLPLSMIYFLIRASWSHNGPIQGVPVPIIRLVLQKLEIKISKEFMFDSVWLNDFLWEEEHMKQTYFLFTEDHVMAYSKGFIADNHSKKICSKEEWVYHDPQLAFAWVIDEGEGQCNSMISRLRTSTRACQASASSSSISFYGGDCYGSSSHFWSGSSDVYNSHPGLETSNGESNGRGNVGR